MTVQVVALPPGWKVRIESRLVRGAVAEGTGAHLIEAMAAAVNRAELMGLSPVSLSCYGAAPSS